MAADSKQIMERLADSFAAQQELLFNRAEGYGGTRDKQSFADEKACVSVSRVGKAYLLQYESAAKFSQTFSEKDAIEIIDSIESGQAVEIPEKTGSNEFYVIMNVPYFELSYLTELLKEKAGLYAVSSFETQGNKICMTLNMSHLNGFSNFYREILPNAR